MEIGAKTIFQLKKNELVWLATHRCKHRHSYLEHFRCYEEEHPHTEERIGFLDIETSNLSSDFGIVLSYCIKERGGKIYGKAINPSDLRSRWHDKRLVQACVADMARFDRIATFYGCRFDIPFLRSRALHHNIGFPEWGTLKHTDVYGWVKYKLRLHSNRLQFACDFFGIPAKDHKLHGGMWTKALTGDKPSIDYIFVHNKEDVVSLELLYEKLLPYVQLTATKL